MRSMIAGFLATAAIAGLIGLALVGSASSDLATAPVGGSNVIMVDGQQVVTIGAKGGYAPQMSVAQAGIPTVLRFVTKGTFDCSSVISIPSLGISRDLPPSGTIDIAVGELAVGMLQGTCGMGMYRFEVVAQEG